jgi:hypothetical protein
MFMPPWMAAKWRFSSLMPLVIHPRIRKAVGRVTALTCVAVFASTGAAFASCQTRPLSTPFTQFKDNSSYFLVPGGSFEGTADQVGWTLSNAQLTPGNEPYHVDGASDNQSLTIDAGGSAVSPAFCADSTMRSLRFFAREAVVGSDLTVQVLIHLGRHEFGVPLGVVRDGTATNVWAPVSPIVLEFTLPAWLHAPVQLRLSVPGGTSSWQVDDVYVDPFRLG